MGTGVGCLLKIYGHWDESWNTDSSKIRTDVFICFTIQWADGGTKSKRHYETIDMAAVASGDGGATLYGIGKDSAGFLLQTDAEAAPTRTPEDTQVAKVVAMQQSETAGFSAAGRFKSPLLASPFRMR